MLVDCWFGSAICCAGVDSVYFEFGLLCLVVGGVDLRWCAYLLCGWFVCGFVLF